MGFCYTYGSHISSPKANTKEPPVLLPIITNDLTLDENIPGYKITGLKYNKLLSVDSILG